MNGYIKAIDKTFADIDKGFVIDFYGTEIKKNPFAEVKRSVDSLKSTYNKIQPFETKDEKTLFFERQELVSKMDKLYNFETKLKKVSGGSPTITQRMSVQEVAKLVVYNDLMDNNSNPSRTEEEIIQNTVDLNKNQFKDKVNALAGNKVFKLIAAKYQDRTPQKWKEILKDADELYRDYKIFLQNHRGDFAVEYATHLTLAAKKENARDNYSRLGELIAKQILTSPGNKALVQGIAAHQFEYSDLEKICGDYLRKNKYLQAGTRNYIDDDTLKIRLENDSLKNEVLTKVAEPLKKAIEQRARQEAAEKANAENAAKQKNAENAAKQKSVVKAKK